MVRTRLAPYSDYNTEIDLDEIIRHFARLHQRRILGTGQCAVYMTQKPRKGDLRVLNSQYFRGGGMPPDLLETCAFEDRLENWS